MRLHIRADLGGGGVKPLNRALLLRLAALVAVVVALDLPQPAQAQSGGSADEQTGRIVARRLDDGRTEFGWQPSGGERVLPTQRYFPANVGHQRWLNSSPVEVEGRAIGRINARQLADGRIEFAFTPTDRARILTDARYFPANAGPNRWLRSTEITTPPSGTGPFIAVSVGGVHSCGLHENGAITCWGRAEFEDYEYGQSIPPAGRFTAISAGSFRNCAIRENGEIACWGDSRLGQSIPPAGRFTAISAADFSPTCAIRESGEIACWGKNHGTFGGPDEPAAPPAGSFIAVAATDGLNCAIAETFEGASAAPDTGEIECWTNWGDGFYEWMREDELLQRSDFDPPQGRYRALSVSHSHACAIGAAGEIACWGNNHIGQGDPPAGPFISVSVSNYRTCAIRESGEIECWGSDYSALDGSIDPPAGSDFIAVSAGSNHACALRKSGAITCWGANDAGQSDAPAP